MGLRATGPSIDVVAIIYVERMQVATLSVEMENWFVVKYFLCGLKNHEHSFQCEMSCIL
jgi:hypothetical protein